VQRVHVPRLGLKNPLAQCGRARQIAGLKMARGARDGVLGRGHAAIVAGPPRHSKAGPKRPRGDRRRNCLLAPSLAIMLMISPANQDAPIMRLNLPVR
jgi:hypothetical protein